MRLPCLLLGTLVLASPARAEEQPVVVELFTSQGCSSCPPADAMMEELAALDGVVALSLHVDYWDYIGWPDSFASPAFSARQEAYARAARERMVYTPQVIVNGTDRVVGNDALAVMAALREHGGAPSPVTLSVAREDGRLVIEAEIEAGADGPLPPLTVHLVGYAPSRTVAIEGGENAGLRVSYSNVVTSWETLGTWAGPEPLRLTAESEGHAVVLLQEEGPGAIRAAAKVP